MIPTEILIPTAIAIVSVLMGAFTTFLISARRMPASHRVAIIGFPQSGKTTLITAVFDFLFRYGARGGTVVPRGDETIRRINTNLEQLELRRPIKPTSDQDVFAYRAEIIAPDGSLRRRYKLEIGDFPGEDTVSFAEQYGEWLHDTPYFQWAMSADAFVFVIDVSTVLATPTGEEVARHKSALRAAWQRFREHHLDGGVNLMRTPLILVFTKADLLLRGQMRPDRDQPRNHGADVPRVEEVSEQHVAEASQEVRERYADLIDYFGRETTRFAVVFTSVYASVDGERLGIPEIARRILPRPSIFQYLEGARRRDRGAA